MQIAHSSPDMTSIIGTDSAFSEYVKFISDETSLPSSWTEEEQKCLWGTSLEKHHRAKFLGLRDEYRNFCEASKAVPWAEQWWGEHGCLTWDDWKLVDAMYRSRAMEFEIHGSCLVPVMDMVNHAPEGKHIAGYKDKDFVNEARLYLEDSNLSSPARVEKGEEITINYGADKGASEFVSSYGFFDLDIEDSHAMFLYWDPPEDDPLKPYKMIALDLTPLIKIYKPFRTEEDVWWESHCVWLMSVNEEDGLKIEYTGITDDKPTFRVLFENKAYEKSGGLVYAITDARYKRIFEIRALTHVLDRVNVEIGRREALHARGPRETVPEGVDPKRSRAWKVAEQLRALEMKLLFDARKNFQVSYDKLEKSVDVQNYIQGIPLEPLTNAQRWNENEGRSIERLFRKYMDKLTATAPNDEGYCEDHQWGSDVEWVDAGGDQVSDRTMEADAGFDSGIEDCEGRAIG